MNSPALIILAGPNGAGKSSIAGDTLRNAGFDYYNPDDETRRIMRDNPALSDAYANGKAWELGRDLLIAAVEQQKDYHFETTLGGSTITELLMRAAKSGCVLSMWFAALESPELHIDRVQQRAARGGHPIPADKIRYRYETSRRNVIRLLPYLQTLRLYDNSHTVDASQGETPEPQLIMHYENQQLIYCLLPKQVPKWAKPIVAAAAKQTLKR